MLGFAEKFVVDAHAVTDEDAARVVVHLGDPGLVALSEAVALFDGFARFRLMLGVESEEGEPRVVATPEIGAGLCH